jgi:hypothetical protein
MLKSYITRIENIPIGEKGSSKYIKNMVSYLMNENHENHIGRTEIFSTTVEPTIFFRRTLRRLRENANLKKRTVGRKSKKALKSLTFNVPISYEPTKEQMQEIQIQLFEEIMQLYHKKGHTEVEFEDIFSNIHIQQNNHINFLLPLIDPTTKKQMAFLGEQSFFFGIATTFTKITDKVLGTSFLQYTQRHEEETVAFIEREEDKEYSLEELTQLKEKYAKKPLIKRLYDYMYRIKAKEIEAEETTKDLQRLDKNLQKLLNGDKITKEEAYDLRVSIAGLKLRELLNSEQQKTLKSLTKGMKPY